MLRPWTLYIYTIYFYFSQEDETKKRHWDKGLQKQIKSLEHATEIFLLQNCNLNTKVTVQN